MVGERLRGCRRVGDVRVHLLSFQKGVMFCINGFSFYRIKFNYLFSPVQTTGKVINKIIGFTENSFLNHSQSFDT